MPPQKYRGQGHNRYYIFIVYKVMHNLLFPQGRAYVEWILFEDHDRLFLLKLEVNVKVPL